MRAITLQFLAFILFLVIFSCTTTKRKGEVSMIKKFYHNTTAKYNGYFNANELIKESLQQLEYSHEDNYNQLIPIHKWEATQQIERQYSTLDTAIKKVSVVVSLHTEAKWTDDCYLLAGKAHYIKRDYEEAERTLQYLVNEFDPSNPSSRFWEFRQDEIRKEKAKEKKEAREERRARKKAEKKARKKARKERRKERKRRIKARKKGKRVSPSKTKEEKKADELAEISQEVEKETESDRNALYEPSYDTDKYTKWGHEPAFKEGQLWLAKTYIARDNFNAAKNLLKRLLYDEKLDRDITELAHSSMADLHLKRRDYELAIPHLENALNVGRKRNQNARYAYLLGQLHQLVGNTKKSGEFYAEAGKLSNRYEMEFAAKVNQILNEYFNGFESLEDSYDRIDKMLSDSKNYEYADQLYFAKAKMAKESGDMLAAREFLAKALQNNSGNNTIVLEAYYTLGTYYYEQDEFRKAKLYHDSIMQVIPKSDPRYVKTKKRHKSLQIIDEQQQILAKNDSALIIAEMSVRERAELIEKRKAKMAAQESKKQQSKQSSVSPGSQNTGPVAGSKSSSFFAYNAQKVQRGLFDFKSKWGDRDLQDDWRRNSSTQDFSGDQSSSSNSGTKGSAQAESATQNLEDEEILGDYPKTQVEKAAVRQSMVDAMYTLAVAYRERIQRSDLAIDVLEDLVRRFPRSSKEIEALYSLILAYRDVGNSEREQEYKEILVDRYPQSKFAKIVQDPNFVDDLAQQEKKLENHYRKAYLSFESGNYKRARSLAEQGLRMNVTDESYMPKFMMIKAMTAGKLEGKEAYHQELTALVKTYERSEEAARAREIIRFLGGSGNAFVQTEGQMGDFKQDDEKQHYVIAVLYNSRELDMNQCKIKVSDFNREYYDLRELAVSNIFLDLNSGIPLIIVRSFENKTDAMKYYQTAKQEEQDFLPEKANYDLFATTQRNYRAILKQRTIEGYRPFFEKYYLRTD
ncbi:MAG: tetratricopeptide repeat protein [Bacteroidetes bacterium]|nr:tetratricopeptide repeat protein [Bacteroidota bacterium]